MRRGISTFYGRNGAAFMSNNDEWGTPQELFDELDGEFGFALDVCASQKNAKCKRYFDRRADGLSGEWKGICWMNPPYGRSIVRWVRKAYESAQAGATIVCLLPARTDTAWWHDYCMKGEIRLIRGRLKFVGDKGSTGAAPFASAIVVFRRNDQRQRRCPVTVTRGRVNPAQPS